jgi:hypothetical protein
MADQLFEYLRQSRIHRFEVNKHYPGWNGTTYPTVLWETTCPGMVASIISVMINGPKGYNAGITTISRLEDMDGMTDPLTLFFILPALQNARNILGNDEYFDFMKIYRISVSTFWKGCKAKSKTFSIWSKEHACKDATPKDNNRLQLNLVNRRAQDKTPTYASGLFYPWYRILTTITEAFHYNPCRNKHSGVTKADALIWHITPDEKSAVDNNADLMVYNCNRIHFTDYDPCFLLEKYKWFAVTIPCLIVGEQEDVYRAPKKRKITPDSEQYDCDSGDDYEDK